VSPFRNIARLFAGDLAAKALQFVTFIYLARTLQVEAYGVLEIALAATSYLVLVGDLGMELWATREVSRERDIRSLAGRVLGLRLALGALAFGAFLAIVPFFPNYPALRPLLVLGGLALAGNIASLRWGLLGRERMGAVATAAVASQFVSTALALALVRDATDVWWVPLARAAGDVVAAALCVRAFRADAGGPPRRPTLAGWRSIVGPTSTMGAIQILGVLSYNFDSLLLGLMVGPAAVGLYGAAYKVVTVGIAASMTYYMGLFPALARTWAEGQSAFLAVARRSLGLAALTAFPIGVAGTILATPAVEFLYGASYIAAAPTLRVLCWSAALVGMR
jgi:O-antigen/teichoic acid export membrane protein